jgi:hypothetical protein
MSCSCWHLVKLCSVSASAVIFSHCTSMPCKIPGRCSSRHMPWQGLSSSTASAESCNTNQSLWCVRMHVCVCVLYVLVCTVFILAFWSTQQRNCITVSCQGLAAWPGMASAFRDRSAWPMHGRCYRRNV